MVFEIMIKTKKLVVITAGLVLAGVALSAAIGASAPPTQTPPASSEQIQKNAPAEQSSSERFGVTGEREFFYKMLVSIVAVIILGAGIIYISKKLLPKISNLPGKQIKVVETTHLGQRKALHLIRIGSRRLLIGSTSESITMLSDVTEPGQSFAAELEKRS